MISIGVNMTQMCVCNVLDTLFCLSYESSDVTVVLLSEPISIFTQQI